MEVLNGYCTVAEKILSQQQTVKIKFTGDEVMAVFADNVSATNAALMIRNSLTTPVSHEGVGLDIGIHKGILMEGILGAKNVKHYDVIGDTMNTAKGIEEAARADEILISLAAASNLFTRFRLSGRQALSIIRQVRAGHGIPDTVSARPDRQGRVDPQPRSYQTAHKPPGGAVDGSMSAGAVRDAEHHELRGFQRSTAETDHESTVRDL